MKFLKEHRPEIIIGAFGIVTYIISLANTFHTDDWLVLNLMRDGFSWSDFLSMENIARFRPLTNVFVYLRYLMFGDTAIGYYALNILLHTFFAVLFYRFLLKIGLKQKLALLSAMIFAMYFQHYEAVLWLYGTIRILAAIFWLASLWALYDYFILRKNRALIAFALFSFLGYFVVEDFVVSPLGFLVFAIFMGGADDSAIPVPRKRIWWPAFISLLGLVIYAILRTALIARPGVVEDYYYFGPHIIQRLIAYFEWMMLPPPDHAYFQVFAARLNPAIRLIWKAASLTSIIALVAAGLYAIIKAPRAVKFMVIFVLIALVPALPLSYKVTSRNLYIPSIGLSVLIGFILLSLYERIKGRGWQRGIAYVFLAVYFCVNIIGVWVTAQEYRKNQTMVASIVEDLRGTGMDFKKYDYILLDHLPGRTIVGPAMIYELGFNHEVIASNDPSAPGPVDIPLAAREVASSNKSFIIFDYRDGHLKEATSEYLR
jgi:hypothetical protein